MSKRQLDLSLLYIRLGWAGLGLISTLSVIPFWMKTPSPLFSLLIVILPYLYLLGGLYYICGWFFKAVRSSLLAQSTLLLLSGLILWPPLWVVHAVFHTASPLSKQDQAFKVVSWNVARMGELEDIKSFKARKNEYQKQLKCVMDTLKPQNADFLVLQEISKSRLNDLKKAFQLSCHHVDYYGVGGNHRGGLGICIPRQASWKFNYAKDVRLPDRWRALFVEVASLKDPKQRFNLINVHFVPTRIGPKALKKAMNRLAHGSPKELDSLFSQLLAVLHRQEAQAQQLLEKMSKFKDPTILAGDFNSPPSTVVHLSLKPQWVDTWQRVGDTFGATKYFGGWIPFRVDFIYSLAGAFTPRTSKVLSSSCSDHLPLVSEFTLLN